MGISAARRIGHNDPLRVAIVDDSKLIFSDGYRVGWPWGFQALGCEVQSFDVSMFRMMGMVGRSPYSAGSARGFPKMVAQNIVSWKPDLVFAHHGRAASHGTFLDQFKKFGIPTACYLCDEPYESGETSRYSPNFSHVFTMDPCTIELHRLSRQGRANVYYLPPAANTDLFSYADYSKRDIPAFFLGNADLPPRHAWLEPVERLVEGCDVRFYPHKEAKRRPIVKGHPRWIDIEDSPNWYRRAVVGLNVHRAPEISEDCFQTRVMARRDQVEVPAGLALCVNPPPTWGTGFWNDGNHPAAHLNPRFFEMAACGALVVSDNHRPELARLFPMAPRASSAGHFLELVQYFLDHKDEAEAIAEACSFLISRRHTYRHRAAEVLIRVGLRTVDAEDLATYLGAPEDWLTPQDFNELGERSSSEPTGLSERWSPAYGLSLIQRSGSVRGASSLDVPIGWWS